MPRSKPALALLALFQLIPAQAYGDTRLDQMLALSLEQLMSLPVTISTSTRQALSKAPAVVSVITAEDIKATGATNLVEALEGVPGIHIRASQFGFRPLVHFRGANATQTLLMVNGSPVKDLLWGFGIFWKGLPASMIERVEIIRGPGSALYGADASAGVINVITKTAGKIETSEAGLRLGSYDTQAGWLQHGTTWNGYDINLTAELSTTDGHDPYIAQDAEGDAGEAGYGWQNQDLRFSMAKGNWRFLADYMAHRNLETGMTGAGVVDPVTRADDHNYSVALLYANDQFERNWALNAQLRYQHMAYDSGEGFQERPPGYNNTSATDKIDDGIYDNGLINRNRAAERQLKFEVTGQHTGFNTHALLIGAGHAWQDLYKVEHWANYGLGTDGITLLPNNSPLTNLTDTAGAFAPEKSRHVSYLFLQDIWQMAEGWELTLGARYDHYSDFGGTFNPRLALVWDTSPELTTKLMYGKSFRPPTFQELYSPTSNALPNADLEPEQSETWELAFDYAISKNLHLGTNFYQYQLKDLIGRVNGQFQNTGDHRIRGFELEAKWQAAPDLRLSGNYTQRHQDDSGYRDFSQPDRQAYVRADWAFRAGWNWNVQANWIGERKRNLGATPPDTRPPLEADTLVDTTLRYGGMKDWEFAASIRNLFNTDAREFTGKAIPDDLPLPGRNAYIEARYRF